MKRFTAWVLSLCILFSLTACGGNETPAETSIMDTESNISAESTMPESSETVSETGGRTYLLPLFVSTSI